MAAPQSHPPMPSEFTPAPPLRSPSLLIVDDDVGFVHAAAEIARLQGYEITVAGELAQAVNRVKQRDFDMALVDLDLPDGCGLSLLRDVDMLRTDAVVVTGSPSVATAVDSFRNSVVDYLVKPIAPDRLRELFEDCATRRRAEPPAPARAWHDMVGASDAFVATRRMIEKVAPSDVSVLVHGESGCGKELIARAIHAASGRTGPFVAVNCGAVSGDLLASQLFGHEKGSFTGAVSRHGGFLEQAAHGTLFLDEISEMAPALQTHLLRVLDFGCYRRLGGHVDLPVEVRIVSATNRDPLQAVASGRLREDLYYRLCGFAIPVAPLRERGDDARLLADAFLADLNARGNTQFAFTPESRTLIRDAPWPGNVRELRNAVQRAYILAEDGQVRMPAPQPMPQRAVGESSDTITFAVGTTFEEMERRILRKTLQHFGNNRRRAAAALGITARTIRNRLARERDCAANEDDDS
ncbi:sigma-54-dependent Fis family transcriptional regulator [Lysobacter helvus]|uniref:Sigma-54-dependent Fis family transcriptional regulator n=3 Tax=Lysobacterales TaxID=135614 RepID=A0ABM7Q5H4_9GAMM|nr:sigma-54-dependent Fis family transcriptional regulator [Lysobacter caseinilyticus]BCT95746.1 sigma-54-dependent Fis family transcriptional regulator [Lysobacter helvus]